MEGLVKQLLTLSKIEAAPSLALNDIIDVPMMLRVVEREAQTLSHNQHTLSFDVDNTLKVLGSEDELRSAISNTVYNAVNHTPKGTHIAVRWQHTPAGAEFSVEDNGPGIGPEHLPRLTERFYRVDKARSRQTGGSGLGLAIVKHAVSHHESRLNIESTLGKGTRFSFVIPERLIAKKRLTACVSGYLSTGQRLLARLLQSSETRMNIIRLVLFVRMISHEFFLYMAYYVGLDFHAGILFWFYDPSCL